MNSNGVIMEPGVIVVGVTSIDGSKKHRFRIREVRNSLTSWVNLNFRQTQCENWSKHMLKWRTSFPTQSSSSTKASLLTALTCRRCSTCSPWRYSKSVEFLGSTPLRRQSQRALRPITWVWKKSQVLLQLLHALVPCQRPYMWSKQCAGLFDIPD